VFTKLSSVKHGRQRNNLLQDLTGLEILVSVKNTKTEKWFNNWNPVCK